MEIWYNIYISPIRRNKKGEFHMKRALLVSLVITIVALATTTAFAVPATVTADVLNLRDVPQGEIIGSVRFGHTVDVLEGPDRNWYYKISYKGGTYYVYGSYLDFGSDLPELPKIGDATRQKPTEKPAGSGVNTVKSEYYFLDESGYNPIFFVNAKEKISIRKYAEPESLRLTWVMRGEPVIVVDSRIANGFLRVRSIDGKIEGYTFAKYLSLEPIEEIDYSNFTECEILDPEIEGICWTIPVEETENDE